MDSAAPRRIWPVGGHEAARSTELLSMSMAMVGCTCERGRREAEVREERKEKGGRTEELTGGEGRSGRRRGTAMGGAGGLGEAREELQARAAMGGDGGSVRARAGLRRRLQALRGPDPVGGRLGAAWMAGNHPIWIERSGSVVELQI